MRNITILLLLLFTFSCSELLLKPEENNDDIKYRQFNEIWETVNQEYPFFELKSINWDSIYFIYEQQISNSQGDEYIQIIYNMLGELKDGHVGYSLKGGFLRTHITSRELKDTHSYSPDLTRSYMDEKTKIVGEGHIEYGIINQSIGYLRIETWQIGGSNWIEDIDIALNHLKNTKGLIIDVRHNGGGEARIRDRGVQKFLDTLIKHLDLINMESLLKEESLNQMLRFHIQTILLY